MSLLLPGAADFTRSFWVLVVPQVGLSIGNSVIATYKRLLNDGVRGRVVETSTGPRGVACRLEVEWPDLEHEERGPSFYQVFLVTGGLVTKIEGHDERDLALAAISN